MSEAGEAMSEHPHEASATNEQVMQTTDALVEMARELPMQYLYCLSEGHPHAYESIQAVAAMEIAKRAIANRVG